MTPRLHLVPLLLFLALPACGGDDDGGGGGGGGDDSGGQADGSPGQPDADNRVDGTPSDFAVHLIRRTCAPNDGPAITLSLGGDYDPETCNIHSEAPFAEISAYLSEWEIHPPVTYSFDDGELAGAGQICPGGEAPCHQAAAGELHFDSFTEGESATGTYRITTAAQTIEGAFDADWCMGGGGPYCG